MFRKIAGLFLLIGLIMSSCTQTSAAIDQKDVQLSQPKEVQRIQPTESEILSQTEIPTETIVPTEVTPALIDDPLASLKGKMIKDEDGFLLLLGFVATPDAEVYFQFPESYQFPHEHIKDDMHILDVNGAEVEFEEVDPGDLNLYVENPLGEGIIDPRAFRILQTKVPGPLTLEMVNLIQGVNLTEQPGLSFPIQFDTGFPLGKNQWDINQTINLIPDHPFTVKYFDATVFNDYSQGKFSGLKNTFFNGSYYLEAAGFEGITFRQIVPEERQAEWPMGGGGFEEACTGMFANCIMSDAGLLKTEDNVYTLEITAYRLIVHGPWQVQFDLPK